jgi:hypothetical protein
MPLFWRAGASQRSVAACGQEDQADRTYSAPALPIPLYCRGTPLVLAVPRPSGSISSRSSSRRFYAHPWPPGEWRGSTRGARGFDPAAGSSETWRILFADIGEAVTYYPKRAEREFPDLYALSLIALRRRTLLTMRRLTLRTGVRRAASGALILGAALVFASPAVAAPPILTSVSHVNRHPAATWTLPPGVLSRVAEVATSPATSTDGYFFSENVKAFDTLEDAQTNWVYNSQLDPGLYYVHIGGIDEPCFFAGLCPVREFSQVMTLEIPKPPPPPPPPPPPRFQASVRSIHPNAVRLPGNWTYLGDTVKVRFRNANGRSSDAQRYKVCNTTRSSRIVCRSRLIVGKSWDAFRLRITLPLIGSRGGRYIEFTWRVEGRIVARRRIKVFFGE